MERLKQLEVGWEVGGHTHKAIEGKDFLVLSPGVPTDLSLLKEASDKKIPVFSEIEVAYWFCEGRIVGITGSNGKTTTATLLGEILKRDKREYVVCGNIGLPFSEVVELLTEEYTVVLELSSFQLEKIQKFHPEIAAVLNITPDHLDRHLDLNSYREAKKRIFINQTSDDFSVLNWDDPETSSFKGEIKSRGFLFSTQGEVEQGAFVKEDVLVFRYLGKEERIIDIDEIRIKGPHNLSNSACAATIAKLLGVESENLASALKTFPGVEHRLEEVADIRGVKYVNDSKATNANSVWYALRSTDPPIILLMGGRDKGGDFTRLTDQIKMKVKNLILLGEAKEKIGAQLKGLVPTFFVQDLKEAVDLAQKQAQAGDCVLLSPGCSSFDMFENYEHRGRVFKTRVLEKKDEK
jgi:UDP-N-acetylmuramoylalanine--D-glutamate ligase